MSRARRVTVPAKPLGYAEELTRAKNTIRKGDIVRVRGREDTTTHDGFHAIFDHVFEDKGGVTCAVRETATKGGDFAQWRFVKPERLVRKRKQEL